MHPQILTMLKELKYVLDKWCIEDDIEVKTIRGGEMLRIEFSTTVITMR